MHWVECIGGLRMQAIQIRRFRFDDAGCLQCQMCLQYCQYEQSARAERRLQALQLASALDTLSH